MDIEDCFCFTPPTSQIPRRTHSSNNDGPEPDKGGNRIGGSITTIKETVPQSPSANETDMLTFRHLNLLQYPLCWAKPDLLSLQESRRSVVV
jgi:hypothetical protein